MNRTEAISRLREIGWTVKEKNGHAFRLPAVIMSRYPKLPLSLVDFLSGLVICADNSKTSWFLCQSDYDGTSNSAFRWDEWEQLSLKAAYGDVKWIKETRVFWDCHFPFLFSVHSGYAFRAICITGDQFGQVVEGHEPEFEEVWFVADSFEAFLPKFIDLNQSP